MQNPDQASPYRLLFVCMGNICRSPAAEGVMKHVLQTQPDLNARVQVDSAGTIDMHVGNAPDPRMTAAAKQRGIALQHAARHFTKSDFEAFDLILVMDEANLADVRRLDREGRYHDKVKLFCEFTKQTELREVPDPYYGGSEGFELVLDLLDDGCSELLRHLELKTQA